VRDCSFQIGVVNTGVRKTELHNTDPVTSNDTADRDTCSVTLHNNLKVTVVYALRRNTKWRHMRCTKHLQQRNINKNNTK
jgi:hypothetical protein